MILVSPPYRTNVGVSFSRLRHDPPGSYSTRLRGRPSMFVLRSMRKAPQRVLADVSVNHSRTGAGKAIDNTQGRASRLSSSGVPFAELQPVPGGRKLGCDPAPSSKKDDSTFAPRVLCSRAVSVAMPAHAVGKPWTPGPSRRGPAQAFSVDRSYVPCAGPALLRRPLAVRSRLGPNVDGVRWPDSKK